MPPAETEVEVSKPVEDADRVVEPVLVPPTSELLAVALEDAPSDVGVGVGDALPVLPASGRLTVGLELGAGDDEVLPTARDEEVLEAWAGVVLPPLGVSEVAGVLIGLDVLGATVNVVKVDVAVLLPTPEVGAAGELDALTEAETADVGVLETTVTPPAEELGEDGVSVSIIVYVMPLMTSVAHVVYESVGDSVGDGVRLPLRPSLPPVGVGVGVGDTPGVEAVGEEPGAVVDTPPLDPGVITVAEGVLPPIPPEGDIGEPTPGVEKTGAVEELPTTPAEL